MFCLSDLLATLIEHSDKQTDASRSPLLVRTAPLTPELIYRHPKPMSALLVSLYSELLAIQIKNSPIDLNVQHIKECGDLCTLEFQFKLNSQLNAIEAQQKITQQMASSESSGAWIDVESTDSNSLLVTVEFNINARVPQPEISFPSWLHGKSVALHRSMVSPQSDSMELVLQKQGASIRREMWRKTCDLENTLLSTDFGVKSHMTIVSLMDFEIEVKALELLLKKFVHSGIGVSKRDILIVLSPTMHSSLSPALKNQLSSKLIKGPLTAHRLINPRNTLMLPQYHETLQNTAFEATSKILLVEDNDLTRRLLRHFFASKGCLVTEAACADEAIRALKTDRFDAIVLDIHLPETPGYDLARVARESDQNAHSPIIAITASKDLQDYQQAFANGIDDCLTKPLNFSDMVKKTKSWMNIKKHSIGYNLDQTIIQSINQSEPNPTSNL